MLLIYIVLVCSFKKNIKYIICTYKCTSLKFFQIFFVYFPLLMYNISARSSSKYQRELQEKQVHQMIVGQIPLKRHA